VVDEDATPLIPVAPVPAPALARVPALLAEWRRPFRRQVPFARQALRVLFDGGRAVFTPEESGRRVSLWRRARSIARG
jgi:hypothetical protein